VKRVLRLKKESKKTLFERPINRREGRKQSRTEYEEMEREESSFGEESSRILLEPCAPTIGELQVGLISIGG
jgi:hypothetical protein